MHPVHRRLTLWSDYLTYNAKNCRDSFSAAETVVPIFAKGFVVGSKYSYEDSSTAERERDRPLESILILILSPNIKAVLTCILSTATLHFGQTRYLTCNAEKYRDSLSAAETRRPEIEEGLRRVQQLLR